jgi:tRNA(fMet)-specific endonuclease VapC
MKGYLLDTSICVALLRGNRSISKKINAIGKDRCFINDVVVAELLFGAYKSERQKENLEQIAAFVSEIEVIPFADSMHVFAQERLRLWNSGNKIEDFDLLIGCAAKTKGLTMVTHNVNHFEHIEGLEIEDWVK